MLSTNRKPIQLSEAKRNLSRKQRSPALFSTTGFTCFSCLRAVLVSDDNKISSHDSQGAALAATMTEGSAINS